MTIFSIVIVFNSTSSHHPVVDNFPLNTIGFLTRKGASNSGVCVRLTVEYRSLGTDLLKTYEGFFFFLKENKHLDNKLKINAS